MRIADGAAYIPDEDTKPASAAKEKRQVSSGKTNRQGENVTTGVSNPTPQATLEVPVSLQHSSKIQPKPVS